MSTNYLENNDYIIPPWDSRYGKLGHLWKRYNYYNIIDKSIPRGWKYLLPKELTEEKEDVWVNCKGFKFKLAEYYLTTQDYYDLMILHINHTSDRPKCAYGFCHNKLKFKSISQGYSSGFRFNINGFTAFCCNEHQRLYHEDVNKESINSLIPTIKRQRNTFIIKSNSDEGVLYVGINKGQRLKFGVASNFINRLLSLRGDKTLEIAHVLVRSSIEEVANIEARLKLVFKSEYIKISQLHNLLVVLKAILKDRPVTNPFD